MSDFLSNLAARALEAPPVIQPRLPSLFEPGPVRNLPFAPVAPVWEESAPEAVAVASDQGPRTSLSQAPAEEPYQARVEPKPAPQQLQPRQPELMLPPKPVESMDVEQPARTHTPSGHYVRSSQDRAELAPPSSDPALIEPLETVSESWQPRPRTVRPAFTPGAAEPPDARSPEAAATPVFATSQPPRLSRETPFAPSASKDARTMTPAVAVRAVEPAPAAAPATHPTREERVAGLDPVRPVPVQAVARARPVIEPRIAARIEPLRPTAPSRSLPAETTVHVTIGRIEVRATTEAAAPRKAHPANAVMSLHDYLKQRSKRGSA